MLLINAASGAVFIRVTERTPAGSSHIVSDCSILHRNPARMRIGSKVNIK
jgi:hypothetical protein